MVVLNSLKSGLVMEQAKMDDNILECYLQLPPPPSPLPPTSYLHLRMEQAKMDDDILECYLYMSSFLLQVISFM